MQRTIFFILVLFFFIYTGAMAKELISLRVATDPPILITIHTEEESDTTKVETSASITTKPKPSNTQVYEYLHERVKAK